MEITILRVVNKVFGALHMPSFIRMPFIHMRLRKIHKKYPLRKLPLTYQN